MGNCHRRGQHVSTVHEKGCLKRFGRTSCPSEEHTLSRTLVGSQEEAWNGRLANQEKGSEYHDTGIFAGLFAKDDTPCMEPAWPFLPEIIEGISSSSDCYL